MKRPSGWALLLAANVLGYCMLSFYQTTTAATPAGGPFPNSTELRVEMIDQLKEIKDLLKEQNALLRSGEIKVVIAPGAKPSEPTTTESAEK
jgi:hypothetical protein